MSERTDKADSERMEAAAANIVDVAATLGVTEAELVVIQAYVEVCNKRLKAAPTALITAEAETHIRKKFPNNAKAIESVDQTNIDDEAMRFIEDGAFGFPVSSLRKAPPIQKAKLDFSQASARVTASPADEDRELSYAKALRWLAKMRVQAAYKDALSPIFEVVHHERRGYKYAAPDQTVAAVSADETLSTLMA